MNGFLASVMAIVALAAQDVDPTSPVRVDDVVVVGDARADMARIFVDRVAAPARGRGLARWREVCPGVVNLHRSVAQPIADRIANRADELGIRVKDAGCEANIVVVFTSNATAFAQTLVDRDRPVFQHGGGGIDRGTAALRTFETSDQPVRWWLLSVPIDSETGLRAVRARGDPGGVPVDHRIAAALGCDPTDCSVGAVPNIRTTSASRLNSQIVDQLYKAIIIVDIDAVAGLNAEQLGDYLAMVALSQVDPQADTSAFDTVLNLFGDPAATGGMTDYDLSYLRALYEAQSRRRTVGAQASAVASIMNRQRSTSAD